MDLMHSSTSAGVQGRSRDLPSWACHNPSSVLGSQNSLVFFSFTFTLSALDMWDAKPASVHGRQRAPLCNISFENSLQLLRFDYADRFQAGESSCLASLTFLRIRHFLARLLRLAFTDSLISRHMHHVRFQAFGKRGSDRSSLGTKG